MNYQKKSNLQIVLDSEPDINVWFNTLIARGRKYNLSIVEVGDKMKLTKDDYTAIINLDEGLDQIKSNLLSLKERFPISSKNTSV